MNLAKSNLDLAKVELERAKTLGEMGAIALRQVDLAQNAYNVASAQYQSAVQAEKMAEEGSRVQEIEGAKQGVAQAEALVRQATSALNESKAAAMQAGVRRKEVEVAKAQISQSASQLQATQVGLGYATIVAPFDGVVVQRFVDPGAMASPGVPLLAIEGGELFLEAIVPERVLPSMPAGTPVAIRFDALGAREYPGKVRAIVPKGDPATHSFVAKLAAPGAQGLKSGMFGRARIQTGTRERLLIPRDATWEREGLHYVFAVNAQNVARLRIVTVGGTERDRLEVLSGLKVGDRIVVGGREGVKDGAIVAETK